MDAFQQRLFNSQRETYFSLKPDAPKTNAFHVKDVVNIEPFCLTQCHQNGWLCKNSCSKTMYCIYHRIYHAALVQNRIDCLAVCSVLTPLLADLGKYRLSAVVSLLCYGDPN